MSDLSITVNGRSYTVTCENGAEAHLEQLANYVDKRVAEVADSVGQVGETRLMLMASLLVADELADAYAALSAERGESDLGLFERSGGEKIQKSDDPPTPDLIEKLAERVEALAGKLEEGGV
ncbi:MAG: cell division protein ZapA [Rhodospirillaceae bacterium]|nr:cell division protein ZapA [Rhodospirillaceae bacterium]|tara:strand:- start:174 stop:539 length:366 start_codon:yes stop_codon:yes gene_type:complete